MVLVITVGCGRLDPVRPRQNRANVFIGFPLGGPLSLAIMACAHLVLAPADIGADQLSSPAACRRHDRQGGLVGIFAATFGAILEMDQVMRTRAIRAHRF